MHGLNGGDLRIESISARALSIPLVAPFVIASGRVDTTRSVEVRARTVWRGRTATGLGEAACLPPVTREDQSDVMREIEHAAASLVDRPLVGTAAALEDAVARAIPDSPVTRAGVETAILDAMARIAAVPLRTLIDGERGSATCLLETDITIPIGPPARMAELARRWWLAGFVALKVKVGKDIDADARALEGIGRAAPGAKLRIDANAGYSAEEAIALARACERLGLSEAIECWEQPCAAEDLDAMAAVAAAVTAPVIADESVKTFSDLRVLAHKKYASGINLKLTKLGGLIVAHRMGAVARECGLKLMAGGMVETRLGMAAAAHLACALGGVDFVDLDTAFLLSSDPYVGGYKEFGPKYAMDDAAGLGVSARDA